MTSRLARLAVAAGLTLFVLWKVDPGAVLRAGRQTDPAWIAAAILLVLFDRALMAYRWLVLLRAVAPERRPPFGSVMRIFFVSTFVGTFLPSVGGDVVRAYGLSRHRVDGGQAAASVLMDRVLGVASLILMALAGLALAGARFIDAAVVATLAAGLLACGVAALAVFTDRASSLAHAATRWLPGTRPQRLASSLLDATRRYARHRGDLANVLAGSIGVQLLRVVQAYCLGRALGIPAPPMVYFAFVPLILLVMLLPITVNGLGTSQVAFVWFFGQAGVPQAAAFTLSILFVALGVVGNLPGAALYAMGSTENRKLGTENRELGKTPTDH
jgi:uncharacterized protein (TIRG00374 family)